MTVSEMRSAMELVYTLEEWERESYALFVERSDPAPCPECGRTGFYGPRAHDPGRNFRDPRPRVDPEIDGVRRRILSQRVTWGRIQGYHNVVARPPVNVRNDQRREPGPFGLRL